MSFSRRVLFASILLASALALFACFDDGDRVAGGTGTSTGNTITARVLGPDGQPLLGAKVILRPMGYVPDEIGISESSGPGSRMEAMTDSAGKVVLKDPMAGNYMLEGARESLVAWKNDIRLASGESRDLGFLILDTAAAFKGAVTLSDPTGAETLWAGFPGTEHFTRLDSGYRFALRGLPTGLKSMMLYRKRPAGSWQQVSLRGFVYRADAESQLPSFPLPAMGSPDTTVDLTDLPVDPQPSATANPCPESALDTLILDRTPSLSVQTLRLRTVVVAPTPQWVELDPCKGSWRSVVLLPAATAAPLFSFASRAGDFVIMPDGGTYYRFTGPVTTHTGASFQGITGAVNHGGKYHVVYGPNKACASFPDTSFLHGAAPAASFPLLDAPDSLAGIAWLGSKLYAHDTRTALAPIYSFDTQTKASTMQQVKTTTGMPIRVMALVKASETALWILDENARLHLWDAASSTVTRTWQIKASGPVRTLSRYPD